MELIRDDGATPIDPGAAADLGAGSGDLTSLIASVQERFRSLFQWHEAQSLQLSADRAVLEVHREQEAQQARRDRERAEADLCKRRTELELGIAAQRESLRREEERLHEVRGELAGERKRLRSLSDRLCAERDELDAERQSARELFASTQRVAAVLEQDRERMDLRLRSLIDDASDRVEPSAGPVRVAISRNVRKGVKASAGPARRKAA
ncbi:MAG: hypothetical protein AAGA57_02090 [Planctomycetota bacterium]